eukprot:jgi/Ulvmu1/5719/UM024_0071.1
MYGSVSKACRKGPRICRIAFSSFCRKNLSSAPRMMSACATAQQKPPKVVVRWPGGSDSIVISIETAAATKTLNRDPKEPVEKSLVRLQASLGGKKQKRKKKSKGEAAQDDADAEPSVNVSLLQNRSTTDAVPPGTPNSDAWREPAALCIGSDVIDIVFNPPTVTSLDLHPRPMVSYPILPLPELQYASTEDCEWSWERLRHGNGSETSVQALCCSERVYVPVEADAGCQLRVTCTPRSGSDSSHTAGEPAAATTDVVALPLPEPLGTFPAPLPPAAAGTFRVVTYNVLADQYASQQFSQDILFRHVPPPWLDVHYRKQLVWRQLVHSGADVLCLQEVDAKVFDLYLQPLLRAAGFSGVFDNKAGQVSEGSAIFYRDCLFERIGRRRVELPELFAHPLPAHLSHFQPLLDASPHLTEALQRVSTIAQAVALQPRQGSRACGTDAMASGDAPEATASRPLVVCNTHLFFHSNASHIRTMHVDAIMMEAFELVRECRKMAPESGAAASAPAVVFCGDLNSDLNNGVPGAIELLRAGRLPASHWDWAESAHFSFGNGRGAQPPPDDFAAADGGAQATADTTAATAQAAVEVTGVDLRLPSSFRSTHGLDTAAVSNYVPGYQGLLDYIWCEVGTVLPVRAFPLPTPAQMRSYVPDGVHPSDHLPVMADVALVAPDASATAAAHSAEAATGRPEAHGVHDDTYAAHSTQHSNAARGAVHAAQAEGVAVAVRVLQAGGVVAVPTDTLYGLAALGRHDEGIERIYDIKGRASHVPLAVCVGAVEDVAACGDCGGVPVGLLGALLPGPVTVVLPRRADAPLSERLNPGRAGVAVRVPDSGFVRDVVRGVGGPVVLTSANRSGQASTVSVGEFRELWGMVDAVFDGGRIEGVRAGSTIVDLQRSAEGVYEILRDGRARAETEAALQRYGLQLCRIAAPVGS